MSEQSIIGVQFTPVGKIYHFSAPLEEELRVGSYVLVSTSRGKQLGRVMQLNVQKPFVTDGIQPIERVATSKDLMLKELTSQSEEEALVQLQDFLKNSRYQGVKALATEYSFDSSRLTLYLNYESDSGFDIKAFLRDISFIYKDVRLEVRQVGPRDVAKALSGLGACGIEKRCCSRFLTEFSSISIKMAKSQDISLTPSEITGMCGRLRCCLAYEHEQYEEARKNLPKRKKVVQTPLGEGKVVQVLPLSDSVVVDLPEIGPRQFTREELETGKLNEPEVAGSSIPVESFADGDVEILKINMEKQQRPPQSRRGSQRSRDRRNPSQRQNQAPEKGQQKNNQDESNTNSSASPQTNRRRRRR